MTKTTEPVLEPCPCCQGTDLVGGKTETDCVYCKTCWLRAVGPAAWNTRPAPSQPVQPVASREEYPLTASIWRREPYGGCPDGEWVLEISGSINDTYFINRHTQPVTTPAEDVAGLPTLYTHPAPSPDVATLSAENERLREALALKDQYFKGITKLAALGEKQ